MPLQIASSPNFSVPSLAETLRQRRQKLAQHINSPVLLWSGQTSSRNFPANVFPYRANSHFLYFAGLPLLNAAIRLEAGRMTLFMDDATPASILWHGDSPKREEIAVQIGADEALPLKELKAYGAATLPVQDAATRSHQSEMLGRSLQDLSGIDRELAKAIVQIRLVHDAGAIDQIRQAAAVTVQAHKVGMVATASAKNEAHVRAAMESAIMGHNMTCAYNSIVTVQGEVLHNNHYHQAIQPGNLLLADVGAETESGWASDVTRTWAVSGQFSPTQRAIYEIVLTAHDLCIGAARPGMEYKDLHLMACEAIAAGLVEVGILRGQPEDLVAMDAHALFFPHGVGHILGLDVHDMEDLGDLAGYEAGRVRSDRFGLGYLRLDRPLRAGMVVTIEPGFYQVPAILQDLERREQYKKAVNWERLEAFADVRGIRIEDDVLITETGNEVLTAELPTKLEAIEELVGSQS
ncbi:MAG: aminopeptidase P family protein [Timaviella obliquedivisa GSE-PSE-MK23-08B]|jgi:Xaa-Pro aminopeptidase/Xaa-Pro dipeptidase|nr:aminopeptidase P family protein [Timaviella obliquedivisa GSE-PSE-MK23-08B]